MGMDRYCPMCGKFHAPTTGACITNQCYIQVVPDSQSFTDLEQIEAYAKAYGDRYLEIAVKNTINNGFKLVKEEKGVRK